MVVLYRFDCIWQKRRLSVKIDYNFTSPKQKKRRPGFKLFLNLTEKNKELALRKELEIRKRKIEERHRSNEQMQNAFVNKQNQTAPLVQQQKQLSTGFLQFGIFTIFNYICFN